MKKHYKVLFEPQEEGGYAVTVPALPGCLSEVETFGEALANVKEVIALYINSLKDDGLPVPEENHLILEIEAPVG